MSRENVRQLAYPGARKKVVRVVGIEPTLLAELDFESSASTSFTTPAHFVPIALAKARTEADLAAAPALVNCRDNAWVSKC